jgi:phospholipid transport system transporter-binding protein
MAATFDNVGPARFRVTGPMTFATVAELLRQSERQLTTGAVEIDLSRVVESDSAGLALLIEWMRLARKHNGSVVFTNVPPQLSALARISEVDELLGQPHSPEASTAAPAT